MGTATEKKKKKWWLIILIIFLVMVIGVGAMIAAAFAIIKAVAGKPPLPLSLYIVSKHSPKKPN